MEKNNISHILIAISIKQKKSILILTLSEAVSLELFYKKVQELKLKDFDFIVCSTEDREFFGTLKDNALMLELYDKKKYKKRYHFFKRMKIQKIELKAFQIGYIAQKFKIAEDCSIVKGWTYFTYASFIH